MTEVEIAKTSPALLWKSDKKDSFAYPFGDRTPLKIRMNKTIVPDFIVRNEQKSMKAIYSETYYCWVNSYGAVSAILPSGERLGLKPGEFEIVNFHEDEHLN